MSDLRSQLVELAREYSSLTEVRELHAEVDARVKELSALHGQRLNCARGCHGCCSDELSVLWPEAARIVAEHAELLAGGEPAPAGGCAFLDGAGGCRIYASRPYVCRTQGLPLRVLFEDEAGEIDECRDICELNQAGPALSTLPEEELWLIGPFEQRLVDLSERVAASERVALRSLFVRNERPRRNLPML